MSVTFNSNHLVAHTQMQKLESAGVLIHHTTKATHFVSST